MLLYYRKFEIFIVHFFLIKLYLLVMTSTQGCYFLMCFLNILLHNGELFGIAIAAYMYSIDLKVYVCFTNDFKA